MNGTYPEREFEVNYPIAEVSKILNSILSSSGYVNVEINEVLQTYKFGKVSGVWVGINHISLVDKEGKTTIKISTMPAVGSKTNAAILSGMQDDFLAILTDFLTGKKDTAELKPAAKGCMMVFVALAAAAVMGTLGIILS